MKSHGEMGRPPVEIRFNGLILDNCIMADEEKGQVIHYGKKPIMDDSGTVVKEFHEIGAVQIILGDGVKKVKNR